MSDHAELRKLAEAATPGPWTERGRDVGHDEMLAAGRNPGWSVGLGCEVKGPPEAELRGQFDLHADAAYIAAMHPQQTIALLDENEALRGALDMLLDLTGNSRTGHLRCTSADCPVVEAMELVGR